MERPIDELIKRFREDKMTIVKFRDALIFRKVPAKIVHELILDQVRFRP
jgi:hypothetical protein